MKKETTTKTMCPMCPIWFVDFPNHFDHDVCCCCCFDYCVVAGDDRCPFSNVESGLRCFLLPANKTTTRRRTRRTTTTTKTNCCCRHLQDWHFEKSRKRKAMIETTTGTNALGWRMNRISHCQGLTVVTCCTSSSWFEVKCVFCCCLF